MSHKSFTLIEVIGAVFLITAGALGVFALSQSTLSFISITNSQLRASYLAQEGIEIVRNIRDSNWLEQRTDPNILWDQGLPVGDWQADYQTKNLTQGYAGNSLNIDANNFYSYSLGQATLFKRRITIAKPPSNLLEVSVAVFWEERGRSHQVTAQTKLYNWR